MGDNKVDQIPWILKSFANTAKKGSITYYALPHYWIMAGTLKSFPSWCRKMCRVNSVASKLSLALLYATCGPFFVVLFKLQQSMLYFALSYTSLSLVSVFRQGFYFRKDHLAWFFHHEVWVGEKPPALVFILTNLFFCWPALIHCSLFFLFCFRWSVLHMGTEQLWSAGLG